MVPYHGQKGTIFFPAASIQTVTLGTTQQFEEQVYSIRASLPMHANEGDGMQKPLITLEI
jgi:hypothetical protein